MSRREIVAVGEFFDFLRRQRKRLRQLAQERIAQAVDPFEVFEEQDQPLEVRRFQLAVDAVERMGNGVGDGRASADNVQIENVVANGDDFGVLRFGDSPDQQMNLARVLREIGRDLLADESIAADRRSADNLRWCRDR